MSEISFMTLSSLQPGIYHLSVLAAEKNLSETGECFPHIRKKSVANRRGAKQIAWSVAYPIGYSSYTARLGHVLENRRLMKIFLIPARHRKAEEGHLDLHVTFSTLPLNPAIMIHDPSIHPSHVELHHPLYHHRHHHTTKDITQCGQYN